MTDCQVGRGCASTMYKGGQSNQGTQLQNLYNPDNRRKYTMTMPVLLNR